MLSCEGTHVPETSTAVMPIKPVANALEPASAVRRLRVYVSGKYSVGNTAQNIEAARHAQWELLRRGHSVYTPHTMTAGGEHVPYLTYEDFMRNDLDWVPCCDAMLMLDGWEESPGAVREHELAVRHGLKIYYTIDEVPDKS